jgi:thioredoxin 1
MLKDILLEYYTASWCGPCRTFKPQAKEMAAKAGVQLTEIDVDDFTDVAMAMKIMSVPTIAVIANEGTGDYREIGRVVGASPAKLTEQLDNARAMGYNVN